MAEPWENNKMTINQVVEVTNHLLPYATNEAGQHFTFEFSIYDDPTDFREKFYIKAMLGAAELNDITFSQTLHAYVTNTMINFEVLDILATSLVEMLVTASAFAPIGSLGSLTEEDPPVEITGEPEV